MIAPAALFLLAASLGPTDAFGTWRTENGDAHVRLYGCDGTICSEVVWVDPEAKRSSRNAQGYRIVAPFTRTETGWRDGRVYLPTYGRTFRSQLTLQSRDRLRLDGCTLALFCGSETWTRLE